MASRNGTAHFPHRIRVKSLTTNTIPGNLPIGFWFDAVLEGVQNEHPSCLPMRRSFHGPASSGRETGLLS